MDMYTFSNAAKSVKGIPINDSESSLSTAVHGQQVAPDRYQATVCNITKQSLKIRTWNVRKLFQSGKLDNVKLEMTRLKVNILGICETKWTGSGEFNSDNFRVLYSGGVKHERGVAMILGRESAKSLLGWWALSDRVMLIKLKGKQMDLSIIQVYAPTTASSEEEIDEFYDTLEKAKTQCKSTDVTVIMGDLNAKIGNEADGGTVGKLWIWRSPGDVVKNQIDYIAIKKRYRSTIKHSKAYPGADCGSDHIPVICELKVKLKTIKKGKTIPRMDDKALVSVAKELIPKREKKSKSKWMTNEILDRMCSRQQLYNRGSSEYKQASKEIRKKCREVKEIWLNEQCEEIERHKTNEPGAMYRKIKEVMDFKGCSSTGCIRSKNGEVLMEKDKILERWTRIHW
ncbi:craniofacial development protein 2-like [Penaeus monodon]|uniref:craniofacial development protein 2-like n=1 Tax=Penaeus monodon TaxID=6687 RepID=UPI0018A70F49|nr:craniofacial development protein 2-like [Penaeus monodon]